MKNIIVILTIIFISSCSNNKENKSGQTSDIDQVQENSNDNGWDYMQVKSDYMNVLIKDVCSSQNLEFIDLYPTLDSIASDSYEKLILVDSLKLRGFKVTNWSRGNWMEGPRIISFTLSNDRM